MRARGARKGIIHPHPGALPSREREISVVIFLRHPRSTAHFPPQAGQKGLAARRASPFGLFPGLVKKVQMLGARESEERGVLQRTLSDEGRGQRLRRAFWAPYSAQRGAPAGNEPDMIAHPDGMRPRSPAWCFPRAVQKWPDARPPKSRGLRRTLAYAAGTRDEGNAADGRFSTARQKTCQPLYILAISITRL